VSGRGPILHAAAPADFRRAGLRAGELVYACVAREAGDGDRVLVIGRGGDRRLATALGVRSAGLAPASRFGVPFSAGVIGRAARAMGAGRVVLRSVELLGTAPGLRRLGLSVEARLLDGPPVGASPRWTRRWVGALERVVVADESGRAAWGGAGVDTGRIGLRPAPEIRPVRTRGQARARIGARGAPVVMPLSTDARHVDARALVFVSGVLELMGRAHCLVVPEGAARWAEALRFRRRAGLRMELIIVRPPMLDLIPAADLLVAPDASWTTGSTGWAVLSAIAGDLGIPIAATAGWTLGEGIGHGSLPPDIRETVGPVLMTLGAVERELGEAG
jgi:hypothetical protein